MEKLKADLASAGIFKSVAFQASTNGFEPYYKAIRDEGYDVQLWASCSQIDPQRWWELIRDLDPSRNIVQIETLQELVDFRNFKAKGVFWYKPIDAYIIGPVYTPADQFGYELASLGVRRTWCEVYKQDGRDEGMLFNAAEWWKCPTVRACFGFYNQFGRSAYNLNAWSDKSYSVDGYKYAVWRWEQLNMG